MPKVETLVEDIYNALSANRLDSSQIEELSSRLARTIGDRLGERDGGNTLRLSNLGATCDRRLWYSINQHERGVHPSGPNRLRFLYGDILETLVLYLAEVAGHSVTGAQEAVTISGVKGHRDAVVDGHLVDVKSASPYGYRKFETHSLETEDPFGYLVQLASYLRGSSEDDAVTVKDRASFLAVDKSSGKMCLDTYDFSEKLSKEELELLAEQKKLMLDSPEPPPRAFSDEPLGKSGNRKLGVACSYCPFRASCWPDAVSFHYSTGVVHLTHVAKEPRVERTIIEPF